jgi:hypothetical protein
MGGVVGEPGWWRYGVVVLLLAAAVVTPTPPALAGALVVVTFAILALTAVRGRHHP